MQIEKDEVEILSGVRFGKAMGGPVALLLRNRDWVNWREKMAQAGDGEGIPKLDTARPGHADLPGILKYGHGDVRAVLERASARETAARVMAGALAKAILRELGVDIVGHVLSIGKYRVSAEVEGNRAAAARAEGSPLRMADPGVEAKVKRWIDGLKEAGTTAGGVVEVIAGGVPPGLGSYVAWDRRLDGRFGQDSGGCHHPPHAAHREHRLLPLTLAWRFQSVDQQQGSTSTAWRGRLRQPASRTRSPAHYFALSCRVAARRGSTRHPA